MAQSPVLRPMMHPVDALKLRDVACVGQLEKRFGGKKIEALIKVHLITLNDLLGLNKSLTDAHIDYISGHVVAAYRNLTLVDIHIICKRAATGYYGELYERLNPPKVLKWFAEYFEERCQAAEQIARDAHSQVKESTHEARQSSKHKIPVFVSEVMARGISGMPVQEGMGE